MKDNESKFKIGDRIIFAGKHCYKGLMGIFVEYRDTPFGKKPVFNIPEMCGQQSFVMNPTDYKRCPK